MAANKLFIDRAAFATFKTPADAAAAETDAKEK